MSSAFLNHPSSALSLTLGWSAGAAQPVGLSAAAGKHSSVISSTAQPDELFAAASKHYSVVFFNSQLRSGLRWWLVSEGWFLQSRASVTCWDG